MIIYENACSCRLCNGHEPDITCRNLSSLDYALPGVVYEDVDGRRFVVSGGRNPYLIILDPDESAVMLTSREASAFDKKVGDLYDDGVARGKIAAIFPASVHKCHKIKKHQLLLILRH